MNKGSFIIITLLILGLFVISPCFIATAAPSDESANGEKKAGEHTALVVTEEVERDGAPKQAIYAGIFVSEQIVVSSYIPEREMSDNWEAGVKAMVFIPAHKVKGKAELVFYDPDEYVALFRVEKNKLGLGVKIADRLPESSDELTAFFIKTNGGGEIDLGEPFRQERQNIFWPIRDPEFNSEPWAHGYGEGSPVIDGKGSLMGVCVSTGYNGQQYYNVNVSGPYIKKIMAKCSKCNLRDKK